VQLAFEAHNGQKRRSGEPFIIHPVEVARILGELVSGLRIKIYIYEKWFSVVGPISYQKSFLGMKFCLFWCFFNNLSQELDWESIAAGLLHDTVEDTNVTFEKIEKEFGATVRRIVEGETKVVCCF